MRLKNVHFIDERMNILWSFCIYTQFNSKFIQKLFGYLLCDEKSFSFFFFIRKNARNLWQNHKNNKNIRIDTNTYAFTMENWFNQFIRLFPSFYWLTWLNLAIISKFVCLSNSLWTNRDFFPFLIGDFDHTGNWCEKKNNFQEHLSCEFANQKRTSIYLCFCAADSLYIHPKHQWWCTTLFILTRISFICGKILTG